MLGLFELLRRFLLMILDLKKLNLNDISPLGNIVYAIAKKCNWDKLELQDIFMIKIRNVIAHDSWYFEDKNFCYDENDTVKRFNLEEFVKLIGNVTDLSNSVVMNWRPYMVNLELERAWKLETKKSK